MSDIGGCRFIFPDIDSLNQVKEKLSNILQHNDTICIKKVNDYITKPKSNDCGYRGVHIHFCHEHTSGKKFNIEAQLRTERQHLWATAVEIVDILEGTKIKTRSHSTNTEKENKQVLWEGLFSIMSDYLADIDNIIQIPESKKVSNARKLQQIDNEVKAIENLQSFQLIPKSIATKNGKEKYILLVVNEQEKELLLEEVYDNEIEAITGYSTLEKANYNFKHYNTLLLATNNLALLADSYPNYAGNCKSFIKHLIEAMNYKAH